MEAQCRLRNCDRAKDGRFRIQIHLDFIQEFICVMIGTSLRDFVEDECSGSERRHKCLSLAKEWPIVEKVQILAQSEYSTNKSSVIWSAAIMKVI